MTTGINMLTVPRIFVSLAVITAMISTYSSFTYAQETDIDATKQNVRYKSGYKDVPQFGGPRSVAAELTEADKVKEPLLRFPRMDEALKPWFDFKKSIHDELGLSFNLDYQALYQYAEPSPGQDDAASGSFRFYGSWTLLGRDTNNTGSLVFKAEHRHRLGTQLDPQTLGAQAGSILPTGTMFNEFGNSSWGVTNLYWQQRLNEGRLSFVVGKVDPTDYLDVYALINPLSAFTNLAFSTNPTIAAPNQGLGAAMGVMVSDKMYVVTGFSDASGDPTDEGFDTFFNEREYFKHVEVGWTPSFERRYLDNIHITAWQVDERKKAMVPKGHGITFSATKFINDKWLPFFRAGYADGDASLLQATVSTGIGYYIKEHRDLLGAGISWGEPSANELDDQYTAELFYRLQVAQNLAITPDIQLIINPALNPDENALVVF
ncbi:MAG: carbohydrate porin, partial [Planctomycetota bacterium]